MLVSGGTQHYYSRSASNKQTRPQQSSKMSAVYLKSTLRAYHLQVVNRSRHISSATSRTSCNCSAAGTTVYFLQLIFTLHLPYYILYLWRLRTSSIVHALKDALQHW